MQVLIAYDICDNKTRRQVFSVLKEKGLNTQKSVFECEIDAATLHNLRDELEKRIDKKTDSVLFYPLCKRCSRTARIIGQGIALSEADWMVV